MKFLEVAKARATKAEAPVLVVTDITPWRSIADEVVLKVRCEPLFFDFPQPWRVWKSSQFEIILILSDGTVRWNIRSVDDVIKVYRESSIVSINAVPRRIIDEIAGRGGLPFLG